MGLTHAIANRLWLASSYGNARRFHESLPTADAVQRARLHHYLKQNADTEFGRRHRFGQVQSFDDYRAAVPLADYDDFASQIDRIAAGETNILTAEPVIRLMPSSGSTKAAKLIPYTRSLQREFNAAIAPWISSLYNAHPTLKNGPAYWSITPMTAPPRQTGVPIGYEEDSAYLGGFASRLINSVLATPACLSRIVDIAAFRYVTLLLLLKCSSLRLISVWHPSFLMLLLNDLPSHWRELLRDIRNGGCSRTIDPMIQNALSPYLHTAPARAGFLQSMDPARPSTIWPALKLISCWADGNAGAAVAPVRAMFPDAVIQPKGLLATEAFVSIPYAGQSLLAIRSHVFEFIDSQDRSNLPHEVAIGQQYTLALTTGGGLYRYRLRDRVRITGQVGLTPAFVFLGKEDHVSDRFGEKLSEGFVTEMLNRLDQSHPFRMLAPETAETSGWYTLFVSSTGPLPPQLAESLDQLLRENPHYDYCRHLGQLQSPRLYRIEGDAYAQFIRVLQQRGQRLGDIKTAALRPETDWVQHFAGAYVS